MNLPLRIKNLEDKFLVNSRFNERIENIFATESFEKLSSKDVLMLKEYFPDKFDFLTSELHKAMLSAM